MGSSLFEYHRINQLQVWPLNENRHPHLTWSKKSVIFSSELLAVRSFDMGVLQSTNNKSSLLPVPSLVFSERKNLASFGAFVFHGTARFPTKHKADNLDKAEKAQKLSSKQVVRWKSSLHNAATFSTALEKKTHWKVVEKNTPMCFHETIF